jgi:predicted ATPase/DNA-binding CsgD family transcriptional regulator
VTQVAPGGARAGAHGFTAALTSFVGRTAEVDEVARLLATSRLVTVTGPGGVGKTRLAAEVAQRVVSGFADGAWLVELGAVLDPGLVPVAVAAALGVQGRSSSLVEALAAAAARRQLLLVLDNCEHVLAAAAELCGALLSAADDVRVLATSREPLAVTGETRYRLAPLSLPTSGEPGESGGSEAVALFADRARQADRHFSLDGETGPLVARLVARLDGMPLAIELAAARVEALGVVQLLERLDDRFRLLAGTDQLATARHGSLAAAVQWSYQLLTGPEQQVFRRLSVFPGPFTLEAAEAVAGTDAGLAVLHLVDCSLLTPPRAGPDGRARYVMLETLRAYGLDRLAEAGEQPGAEAALAGFALWAAERAAPGLQATAGELELDAARWLDAEDATVHWGLGWALEHDPALALRPAVALAPWWRLRGRIVARSALLRAAAAHSAVADDAWCAAQFWLGRAAFYTLDFPGALGHLTAVRDVLAGRAPSQALVQCLSWRSAALAHFGRVAEQAEDARGALVLSREIGDRAGEALALVMLSFAADCAGDVENALAWALQAQAIDPSEVPGWVTRECSTLMTTVLIHAGELAVARRTCADGLVRCRQAGELIEQAGLLTQEAVLDRLAGHTADAAAHLREAIQIATRIGDRLDLGYCVDEGGHLFAATRRWAEALTLWAAYSAWLRHERFSDVLLGARRRREPRQQACAALGPAQTRAAEERGATMSLETAAELAILLTAPVLQAPPGQGKLSARERELVTLVARGRTDAQIAEQLCISVRTVRSHLDRIRDKTGCRRRADLTRLALTAGLV